MTKIFIIIKEMAFRQGLPQGLPPRWLAPSSCMVYWAIAELYLRAQFLG